MNTPQLVFSFDPTAEAHEVIQAVAAYYAVSVSINGGTPTVPAHIKQAVEQYNPASGVETSAAIAFGGLTNGGISESGNVAPLSAVADTSTIARAANPAISQTSQPALSALAPLPEAGAVAQTVFNAESPIHATTVDGDGVPHDPRIHSHPPGMTEKGVWRKKRGVTPVDHKRITEELKAMRAVAAPVAQPGPTFNKHAAVALAHAEAIKTCGAQPISDAVLNELLAGHQQTLSPSESNWYYAYFARRNEVYSAIKAGTWATVAPVVQPAVAVAPASLTSAPASAELDATGLPHDPRLHMTPALKDPQGVYIQRMDIAPEAKLAIMAELRGNAAAQASTSPGSVASSAPAVPQVTAVEAGTSFASFMRWAVQNTTGTTPKVTQPQINDVVKNFGIVDPTTGNGSIAALNNEAYVPYLPHIVQTLQAMGAV